MKVTLTNIYNNTVLPDSGFKPGYGNAFVIQTAKEKVLYDTGWKGDILLHNMNIAGIKPNSINTLILSHGHFDHSCW